MTTQPRADSKPVASIVRENLLTERGYSPYCGNDDCNHRWPRTQFDGKQFHCRCGWQSNFEPEFITKVIAFNAGLLTQDVNT